MTPNRLEDCHYNGGVAFTEGKTMDRHYLPTPDGVP
jgi:hypothetical protein